MIIATSVGRPAPRWRDGGQAATVTPGTQGRKPITVSYHVQAGETYQKAFQDTALRMNISLLKSVMAVNSLARPVTVCRGRPGCSSGNIAAMRGVLSAVNRRHLCIRQFSLRWLQLRWLRLPLASK
jgi:hypothetical protein